MLVFVGLILVVIGLAHFYLWKRLVGDTMVSPVKRRVGTVVAVELGLLVPLTLIGVRAGWAKWFAWPGYLWIALMFYLLVTLIVLEIPRLAIVLLWWRRKSRTEKIAGVSETVTGGSQVGAHADGPGSSGVASGVETAARRAAATDGSMGDTTGDNTAVTTGDSTGGVAGDNAGGVAGDNAGGVAGDNAGGVAGDNAGGVAGDGAVGGAGNGGLVGVTGTGGMAGTNDGDGGATGVTDGDATGVAGRGGNAQTVTGSAAGDAGPGGVARRLVLARGMAIFAGLTSAGVTGYGVKTALGAPQLDRVQIPLAKLPRAMDGTRLAVVSDIHLGPLTGSRHVGRIVELINSVNADIVCVVGDLVDGTVAELGRFAAPLAEIKSRRGAYFVTGNHEYYSGFQPWVDEVARLGVRPLRNERLELDGLDLAGVNDLGGAEFNDGPDFARALGDRDPSRPVVLMAHQPVVAKQAAPFGVDLQVSGHTHGGQMAPFNLLVKLQQPVVSGLGEVDGVPVYVTNGAGFWGPPVRVGAPPQVTVIELRAP
ncbi:metallophosphoesterase [Micromonosporaceae bacterium Da 78-11]